MKQYLLALAVLLSAQGVSAGNYEVVTTDRLRVWAVFPDKVVADGKTVNYVDVFEHDDDGTGFCAFNMEIVLPDGFRVNKVKDERKEVNDIFLSERANGTHVISCNLLDGKDLRIISISGENAQYGDTDKSGNPLDKLFTVGLIADPTLTTGDYHVKMDGVKFSLPNADARVPATFPEYTIHVVNTLSTSLETVEVESLAGEDCYDLSGLKVDPTKVHGEVVVSRSRKVYVK